jgi:hypothetical protein
LFHLLTIELLMDQLVQSFRIQTPICLDQFLQIRRKTLLEILHKWKRFLYGFRHFLRFIPQPVSSISNQRIVLLSFFQAFFVWFPCCLSFGLGAQRIFFWSRWNRASSYVLKFSHQPRRIMWPAESHFWELSYARRCWIHIVIWS